MSAGDENVFTRWSRRKQAVRSGEVLSPDEDRTIKSTEGEVEPVDQPLPGIPDNCEPLPRLEDLTAESGLSVFLRKGVPEALRRAALRKMWSLDPAIRDHIGLSEYAWDFNQSGSMAGFGPLAPNESVAEFLSTMSEDLPFEVCSGDTPRNSLPATSDSPGEPQSGALPDGAPTVTNQPVQPEKATEFEPPRPIPAERKAEPGKSEQPIQSIRPKRHGGAVPR